MERFNLLFKMQSRRSIHEYFDSFYRIFYTGASVEVNGHTKVFGIIGDPVSHSMSPLFQNRFLKQSGVNGIYVPFHISAEGVADALRGLWAAGVEGLNITIPHKQVMLGLSETDQDALLIGAVNTVRRSNTGWQACNTDFCGFLDVLCGMDVDVEGARVLMFGAGGTARAIVHALAIRCVGTLQICNRGQPRLAALLAHISANYPDMRVESLAWEQDTVLAAGREVSLIVNTSSIGLTDDSENRPFPFQMDSTAMAVDVVYAPSGHTPFVNMAKDAGCVSVVDGLPMLLAQGAASFRFWHGDSQPTTGKMLRWMESGLGRASYHLPGWDHT